MKTTILNILFYYPSSQSSVSLETLMEEFVKMGHNVYLLGQEEKRAIQDTVEKFGVQTEVYIPNESSTLLFYLKHVRYLRSYVKQHHIDLIYAHTQPANIVAVFAQMQSPARYIICRHHSDHVMMDANKNAKRFDKIINRLGKEFIVPSQKVFTQLTEVEGVNPDKVRIINYAYRFENYAKPDTAIVADIRNEYSAKLLLVTVSRFIPCKRYDLLIDVVKTLTDAGLDLKLLILGWGPLEAELKDQVMRLSLTEHVIFIGFTTEVMNYLQAADVVVHTSNSEASNNVVKEAGILEKTIIACEDVGDFDDYIVNRENGFLISKENTASELEEVLKDIYSNSADYFSFGNNLKESVYKRFSVENIIHQYEEVL